ncbi:MAG: T9SS type A sorting domain-containing protein [Bacteroidales bacterium]|nr:T9SS type A sorting domain-containing protein [Bacteroidales bacterium]
MKLFTKFTATLLALLLSAGILFAQTSFNEVSPKTTNTPIVSEELFDLQFDYPVGIGGGEAGIESDGNYIYTSMWNGAGEFQKYEMNGTWVETFTITGSDGCRDIAWDGTYFYGAAANPIIFQMDFDAGTMVSTFTAPTDVRAIAYNEDDDAFYGNNWGSDIVKFDMAGANMGSFPVGPTGDSYYGLAYQGASYCDDGPYLWGYAQVGATQNELVQIELPAGNETGTYFDVGSVAGVSTGIAGGLAISDGFFADTWTIFGTAQNVNIWGLELCGEGVSFDPPENVTAEVYDMNNVMVDWDAPTSAFTGTILCVDRDGSNPAGALDFTDDWQYIQPALDANGFTYDYFEVEDVTTEDGPDLATMEQYDIIIWFCGEGWQNNQTMTDNDENNLAAYLDGGGSLLLSAHDYFYDRYPTAGSFSAGQFPYDYLGVGSTTQDNWSVFSPDLADIEGVSGSFADGLSYSLSDIYTTGKEGLYIDLVNALDQDLLNVTNPAPVDACAVQFDGGTFKSAFTTASIAAFVNPDDAVDFFAAAVSWLGASNSDDLTGYDIYRNGNMIGSTTSTSYDDTGLIAGTYEYCVKAVYDEGSSIAVCADEVTVEGTGGDCLFDDDFESYNVGEQLVLQNPDDWTTWSNAPGSAEDPYIVGDASQTVEISGTNDLVYVIPNFTSGFYTITFDMLVPDGYDGYFNTLQEFAGGSSSWGMQVYFNAGGAGSIDGGGAAAATFTFPYDTWMAMRVEIDMDNDWAEYFIDDALIHGWVWSSGTFGTGSLNQLGGNNFYAGSDTQDPLYYIDNYCLAGEAPPVLDPPANLTGPDAVYQGNDINLTWDAPGTGGATEELIYDNGVNTGGYSYEGYTMSTHMSPAGPCKVLTLKYYTTTDAGDNDFNATVFDWNGTQPGLDIIYEENVMAAPDDWIEVDVSGQDITFDGDFVVGFGSVNGTTYLGFDGDLNNGRSWDFNNGSPSWSAWSEAYLIRAVVQYTSGSKAEIGGGIQTINVPGNLSEMIKTTHPTDYSSVQWVKPIENISASAKELQGYNVYRDGSLLDYTTETEYTDNIDVLGLYEYYVTAVYDEGESIPSNTWTVDVVTGVDELLEVATTVFPNPASDVVNVKSEFKINTISVYNYSGQMISFEIVNDKTYRINTSELNQGIYFLQINTDEGMISKRIIVE